jgi:bifunctional DNA-binding transcriptional regulator/antitoxin component of YhaV-PrlF toxin-antitoxin module
MDMPNNYLATIDEDEEGNFYLVFPPEVLDEVNWKIGDTLIWTDNSDGTWTISKSDE